MMKIRSLAQSLIFLQVLAAGPAAAVEKTESWEQAFPVTGQTPRLLVRNVWGSVRVSAGGSGEIRLAVNERRRAPTQALFERSYDVLPVMLDADDSSVSLVLGGLDRWQQRDPCRGCRVDLDIQVWVPAGARIEVGTVNDGEIRVTGVEGDVSASNVNGPVLVSGARSCSRVESINGPLQLELSGAPLQPCELETVNGDITVALPADSGMDLAVDLFNGAIRSEFEVTPVALAPQVEESRSGERRQYRISKAAGLRIGAGGPAFSIKSLNGDIAIKEI